MVKFIVWNVIGDQMQDKGELITCKDCKKEVRRYRGERRPNAKDTRYTDIEDREFNGLRCPPCHTEKVRIAKYNKALAKRALKVG